MREALLFLSPNGCNFREPKPLLYDEWNDLFREINISEAPPTEEHNEKIKVLRKKGETIEESYFKKRRK